HVELPRFEEHRQEKYKRYKSSGSNSFNTPQSGEGSFNFNVEAGGEGKEDVHEVLRPMGRGRAKNKEVTSSIPSASSVVDSDEASARLMITEYASQTESCMLMKIDDHTAVFEIKRMEMEMQQKKIDMKMEIKKRKLELKQQMLESN
nr:hypothetical protein [Tanacetum cinerariifolium]